MITFRAGQISKNSIAMNWLEVFLFLGASYLLLSKRGSHNFRLIVETVVWIATANILSFKYIPAPFAYMVVGLAVLFSFFIAYARAKT
jgi:hypothetical protein